MNAKGYTFKIVVFTEQVLDDTYFIAQCLNPDVCVQAKNEEQALYRLFCTIADNISLARKFNVKSFSNFGKAPKYYVDMFEKAECVI